LRFSFHLSTSSRLSSFLVCRDNRNRNKTMLWNSHLQRRNCINNKSLTPKRKCVSRNIKRDVDFYCNLSCIAVKHDIEGDSDSGWELSSMTHSKKKEPFFLLISCSCKWRYKIPGIPGFLQKSKIN
jgi:hypothetical protein